MNSVVHFEIPADDISRAKKFYSEVFGWKTEDVPEMDYVMVSTTEIDEQSHMPKKPGAINGGMMERDPKIQHPIITIAVEDIDDAIEKIKANGGEEIKAKMEVGDMGWAAYFKDTENNILGLFQMK